MKFLFQGLEKVERFEFIMLSESILEKLEPTPNVTDEMEYGDDQVYEDVDGYESLRKIFK